MKCDAHVRTYRLAAVVLHALYKHIRVASSDFVFSNNVLFLFYSLFTLP